MTQSREVLAMMDAHTTTFGRKRSCTISICSAFLLGSLFLLTLVITALLVYHFVPCADIGSSGEYDPNNPGMHSGRGFPGPGSSATKLYVRLPRSVVPVLYKLKLTPFIWEGNFTFNGEVRISLQITKTLLERLSMSRSRSFSYPILFLSTHADRNSRQRN